MFTEKNILIAAVVAAAIGIAVAVSYRPSPVSDPVVQRGPLPTTTPAMNQPTGMSWDTERRGAPAPSLPGASRPAKRMASTEVIAMADSKYKYLFARLSLSDTMKEHVRRLLIERDQLVTELRERRASADASAPAAILALEAQLGNIEGELRSLLGVEYARYEMLRDAEAEVQYMSVLTERVAKRGGTQMTFDQELAVFDAKLQYKAPLESALKDSRIYDADLSADQRQHAHLAARHAAKQYHLKYLEDVKRHVKGEQYALLSEWEELEYNKLLRELRQIANGELPPASQ